MCNLNALIVMLKKVKTVKLILKFYLTQHIYIISINQYKNY